MNNESTTAQSQLRAHSCRKLSGESSPCSSLCHSDPAAAHTVENSDREKHKMLMDSFTSMEKC